MFSDNDKIEVEINYRKISEKFPNVWKLNSTLLSNPWVKECVTKDIRQYFMLNKNENTTYQTLQDGVINVSREKFTALHVYMRKEHSKSTN